MPVKSIGMKTSDTPRQVVRTINRGVLALAYLCIALLILELSAQVYVAHFANAQRFRSLASWRMIVADGEASGHPRVEYFPHRYLGFYNAPNYRSEDGIDWVNSLGYRGDEIQQPKPDGTFRIVCMGDITSVDNVKKTFPAMLQQELRRKGYTNIEVIDAYATRYTTWEGLIDFETRILDLDPDMVILDYGFHDAKSRLVWPPEDYAGDNSGKRRDLPIMPSILEYSTLYRGLQLMLQPRNDYAEHTFRSHGSLRFLDERVEPYYTDEFFVQKVENRYPSGIFQSVSAAQMFQVNKPIYFERNLEHIVLLAKHHNIDVIMTPFAYTTDTWDPFINAPEFIDAHVEMKEITRQVAERNGVRYLDLSGQLNRREYFMSDGGHVTEEGAAKKAQVVADFIVQQQAVPKP